MTHHGPDSGEATTFPHIVYYVPLCGTHPNGFLFWDSQGGVLKLSQFGLPGLCMIITLCSDLRLKWGLKQTYNFPWELSNSVPHFTYTHRGRVNSWPLVVSNQIANLTLGPSFCHNLCCQCPNGPCETIFDIYTSIAFQWYEEHTNGSCFDPWNRTLKF